MSPPEPVPRTVEGMTSPDAWNRFSALSTMETLRTACARVGIASKDAELIRIGENALYRLSSERLVVRIARSLDLLPAIHKEVRVARWLASHDFPAVRLAEDVDQPLIVGDRALTFWRLIETDGRLPSVDDLARTLRSLHLVPPTAALDLPALNPFDRVQRRLEQADVLSDDDRGFLLARLQELAAQYDRLSFDLPSGPIHGDAHAGNLLVDRQGIAWLLDLEMFADGPREWDISLTAAHYQGFHWIDREQYQRFAEIYGYDVTTWPGFPVLRAIRELTMTTWLMQNVREHSDIAAEFKTRLRDLRDDAAPRRWRPF
jgi:aminoglycoside phosphotransferase (APT) family kinase protein